MVAAASPLFLRQVFAVTYATLVRAATDLMVFELLEPLASQVISLISARCTAKTISVVNASLFFPRRF